MLGDLPDADVKPPENVLFVCKLNPVTEDDDLELIFSRFGKIVQCDVIRDYKTGAFCAELRVHRIRRRRRELHAAYFKMDGALVDDRRIHVDFSQSVSGLWNKRRRGETMTAYDGGGGARRRRRSRRRWWRRARWRRARRRRRRRRRRTRALPATTRRATWGAWRRW